MSVVHPVPADRAPKEVQPIYQDFSQKFGKMPNFFALMAHRPKVLASFLPLYGAITAEGTVDPKLKELAYLKTSMVNGCEYCSRAHMASGKRVGVTPEQIADLQFYHRSPRFSDQEKTVILYADRVTRGSSAISEHDLAELRRFLSEDQIVELTLVICVANFTNRLNNALEAIPDLGDV